MITAINVANTFLKRAFQDKISISPMKLQKLIYILFKEYYKRTGYKLFSERFEAWDYGPVLPNVYSEFKMYKSNPIREYSLNNDGSYTTVNIVPESDFENIFNEVWNKYKDRTGIMLSKLTHQKDSAWEKAIKNKTYILDDSDIFEEKSYE